MIDPYKIIEKYYKKGTSLYFTLMVHSEQVKDMALKIADRHPELNLDKQFISEAALLHDIGIFMCKAPRISCNGKHHYIEHGYLGAEILRKEHLPHHANVCERHTGVGLLKEIIIEKNLPVPHRNMIPITLEEKVICYADKFFSKSKLAIEHSIEEIRDEMSKYGQYQVDTFDAWHKMFSLD